MHTERFAAELLHRIDTRSALIGVIGLGYVGLPLAIAVVRAGFHAVGFDIDPIKPARLNAGKSYIDAVSQADLTAARATGRFRATVDMTELGACDVIIICVPTPLTRHREPDLTYVEATARAIATHLAPGKLVVLESTTYPGTTSEILQPILEANGLRSGIDLFVGFSPEREDPGNANYATATIPKVVAGDGPDASRLMQAFYGAVVERVVPVSSCAVAEAVKITENIFRAVNIALVNELKVVYEAMGIDVWEVIDAAKTKPFGYMPFYPGPGLGGHCIPIDPFYLTWKARVFEISTRFVELAGEINTAMPRYVIDRLIDALNKRFSQGLNSARILIIGLAYKRNVSDVRESPSFKLMDLIERGGAICDYHDPHVTQIPRMREHAGFAGRYAVPLEAGTLGTYNAVVISTDHDKIDYALIQREARLVIDTRNVFARKGIAGQNILKA